MPELNNRIRSLYEETQANSPLPGQGIPPYLVDLYHNLRTQLVEKKFGEDLPILTRESPWLEFKFAVGQMNAIGDSVSFGGIPLSRRYVAGGRGPDFRGMV